uniref:Uncharacterized protein n=1 Tax=Sphaerodactylus townsendi TaxID=933632 RepID=A0ACB8EJ45_9SAUR
MTDMGCQLLEQCAAEAESQRLAHEAEQEWRREIREQMRLDREAFFTMASCTHELMAEWTDVLRRLTELRIQQHGDLSEPLPQLAHLPDSPPAPGASRGPCPHARQARSDAGAAGPASSVLVTHNQLLEAARSPSPVLVTCSQLLEAARPPPPVWAWCSQSHEAAGPSTLLPLVTLPTSKASPEHPTTPKEGGLAVVAVGPKARELGCLSEGGGVGVVGSESL